MGASHFIGGDIVNETQVNLALYDKMRIEQDDYREWLLSQPRQEILNHAYEYSVREDILATMSEGHLPPHARQGAFGIQAAPGKRICRLEQR